MPADLDDLATIERTLLTPAGLRDAGQDPRNGGETAESPDVAERRALDRLQHQAARGEQPGGRAVGGAGKAQIDVG